MSLAPCILSAILGWGIVVLVTPCLLKTGRRLSLNRWTDFHHHENKAIPRLGGFALVAAFVVLQCFSTLWGSPPGGLSSQSVVITLGSLATFALGFWDDLQPLDAGKKLLGQVLIAGAVSCSGMGIDCLSISNAAGLPGQSAWEILVSIVWLVGFTNLINLIDGADGLAGGISLILMTFITFTNSDDGTVVCLTAGMSGALLAFLRYNYPPARIYLGDSGAYLLGFQLGLFSMVASHQQGSKALAAPLFGLALPIADMGLAVLRRSLIGLPLFRPDRNHVHHQLLALGMSPRRVVMGCYCTTLLCLSVGAVGLFCWSGRFLPLSIIMVLLMLLACAWKTNLCRGWAGLLGKVSESLAMRREISYALCLRKWLKQEGERCSSVEDFYADFRMAAYRLGFTTVRVELADGDRLWRDPQVYGAQLSTSHSFQGGALGILELAAPKCRLRSAKLGCSTKPSPECDARCPLWNNPGRIKLLGELLAEAWIDAARRWGLGQSKLRFGTKLSEPCGSENYNFIQNYHGRAAKIGFTSRLRALPRRFFGRVLGFIATILALTAFDTLSSDNSQSKFLHHELSSVPRIELPGKAAGLVIAVPEPQRPTLTTNIMRAAYKVSPAIVVSVVSTISKAVPSVAETAAVSATELEPERAGIFAKVAAAAAPNHAGEIVRAVFQAAPHQYRNIAESVAQVVPGSTSEVLGSVVTVFPEFREPLRETLHTATAIPSSTSRLYTAAKQSRRHERSPGPTTPVRGSPQIRGLIGPPFVPFPGTVTNITSSTSGTVPTGGRNYATP